LKANARWDWTQAALCLVAVPMVPLAIAIEALAGARRPAPGATAARSSCSPVGAADRRAGLGDRGRRLGCPGESWAA